jgi:hypothetical protein
MAKQTFTTGQVLTAAQMTSLQQTAMLGGAASAKTASYTLVAADAGSAISMSNASATTITVNTALFAAGDTVHITNLGAGVCTITAGTATVNSSASLALAQYESGFLDFTSTSAAIFVKGAGAAAASGGMTLLSTTTLSTSSVSISGIDGSYNNLLIIINGATTATATVLRAQANGSTTLSKIAGYDAVDVGPLTNVIGTLATTTSTSQTAFLLLNNYANTSYNKIGNFGLSTNTGNVHSFGTYLYQSTSAISSITITNSTTVAFTGGQVLIYGVK